MAYCVIDTDWFQFDTEIIWFCSAPTRIILMNGFFSDVGFSSTLTLDWTIKHVMLWPVIWSCGARQTVR